MEQNVFIWGSSAFVTYKFLIERKVPESTIYNNTSKKNERRWFIRTHPTNSRLKLIAYDTIQQSIIVKYKLPTFSQLKDIALISSNKFKEESRAKVSQILKLILDLEYNSWETIKPLYMNEFFDDEKIEMFCKTHLLLSKIVELNEFEYKLLDLYDAYNQYDGLIFESLNYHSFCNKICKIRKSKCVEDELLHGLRKRESNNHKMNVDIIIEIKRLFNDPKKLNSSQILEEVNDFLIRMNRKSISLSSVQKVISQIYTKNESIIPRYGKIYAENHLLPYMHFDSPKTEGALWLMDGSRFQFAYKTEKAKFNFLTYYVVLDGRSKKVIGYSFDESENSKMAIEALEKACKNTNYLACEIIADNSSAYRTEAYTKIISNAKVWGVRWEIIPYSNPRYNAYVERFFGVFQESFCKKYDGYLGDGIKSRNLNGRPSPEEIKKYLSTRNLRSKQELIELVKKLITDYNDSKERIELMGNDELVKLPEKNKKPEPIPLNSIMYSTLFWNQRDLTMHNGSISFNFNKEIYDYNIYDDEILLRYHGTKVRVRHDKLNLSKIMLFDLNKDEYICTLDRFNRIPKASIERDDKHNAQMMEHVTKKKELRRKLIQRVKNIEAYSKKNRELLPPELTQFTSVSKEQQEGTEDLLLDSELEELTGTKKFKTHEIDSDSVSYKEAFKNLYKQKGNLKPFTYGSN